MQQPMDEELHTTEECEVNQEFLQAMKRKTNNPPKLLTRGAAKTTCSIFRLPRSFKDLNGKSYQPRVVSIGPYHRGEPNLKMMEEHKWVYLRAILRRLELTDVSLEVLFREVHSQEAKARECYSEEISMSSDDFIEMMILDGCFIVELFRRFEGLVSHEFDDPIFRMAWIFKDLCRDLLGLENQIPLFVLQLLFNRTGDSPTSLTSIALSFMTNTTLRLNAFSSPSEDLQGKHLLDLVRASYVESLFPIVEEFAIVVSVRLPYSVSMLQRSGIEIRESFDDNFLAVRFEGGILNMPVITIDDWMSVILVNCVAYEQCRCIDSPFSTYVWFLGCLVKSAPDVKYLCDRNIIDNYFGSVEELAKFISTLGSELTIARNSYLWKVFDDLGEHYEKRWQVQVENFKYSLSNASWPLVSLLAAGVLLLLTMVQTFYTIYGVYHK